jgi:hypothetical protein
MCSFPEVESKSTPACVIRSAHELADREGLAENLDVSKDLKFPTSCGG